MTQALLISKKFRIGWHAEFDVLESQVIDSVYGVENTN